MSDTPNIRSYQSILNGMVSSFTAKAGVKALATGSPILSLLESAARSDLRDSMTTIQLLNSSNLDNATGLALLRKGQEAKVPKITTSPATGKVTITDSSFPKLASQLYQGSPSPIVGSVTIDIVDGSLFPDSGSVYIGRGTSSYEGPIAYTGRVNNTSFWTLTLSSPTTKFHNSNEGVVLAQGGNRQIGTNVVVQTSQGNLSSAVSFNVLYPVTILDGEISVANVDVIAQSSGTVGNVGANSISRFVSNPFTGATVTNPAPFTTGLDTESDDDYRARIRDSLASKIKGTSLAIVTNVIGIKSPDENKTLSSASLVRRVGYPTTLYIDDGTGYEEVTKGAGIETLVSSALGGEQYFDVANRPIAKAFVITVNQPPYVLQPEQFLSVKVGGVTSIHSFDPDSFLDISNATAYEVSASINANPDLLFLARTSGSGNAVVLFAKSETNEDIEVIPNQNDANTFLGFSSGVSYTTQLYKNDIRLNKDGRPAKLFANSIGIWNSMSGNQTLIISVDNTPTLTFTFTDQDFIDAGTGFNTLGINDIAAWVAVINAKVPGITAGQDNGVLFIISNAGPSTKSALNIIGGTLIDNGMFAIGSDIGLNSDYTLDRNMGEIQLAKALSINDTLSLGSANTRAFLQSLTIPTTTLAATARLWLQADGNVRTVQSGITANTSLVISVASMHEWGYLLKILGPANTFNNVQPGDWVVLWDSAFDSSIRDAFRVVDCTSTYILIERRLGLAARGGHKSVAMLPVSTNISRVFTCGGYTRSLTNFGYGVHPLGITSSSEIYDPNTKTFSLAKPMSTPRAYHTATTLANGKVYVTGGFDDVGNWLTSTELYDPGTDTWTVKAPLTTGVIHHRAILLNDGTVLICGGYTSTGACSTATYRYDPVGDTLATVFSMGIAKASFGIAKLPSGKVLIAGGRLTSGFNANTSATFDPGTNTWTASAGVMPTTRSECALTFFTASPTTLACIGSDSAASHADGSSYDDYIIGSDSWTAGGTTPFSTAFKEPALVYTQDGSTYIFHGSYVSGPDIPNTIKIDPTSTFSSLGANPVYTEAAFKYNVQAVLLYNNAATYLNHIVITGGTQVIKANGSIDPTATVEEFDGNSLTFSTPDLSIGTIVTGQAGMTFVRSLGRLQELTVPAAANYTATSLVTALNAETTSALANVYQTNKIRINTNSFGLDGNIALVAQNTTANVLGLTPGNSINNVTGHIGSIESFGSSVAQPSFQALETRGSILPVSTDATSGLIINNANVDPSYTLVGLRSYFSGANDTVYKRYGSDFKSNTTIISSTPQTSSSKVEVRAEGVEPRIAYDRVYAAAPFAIGSSDNLVVTVDNDISKEFNINLARKLQTTSSTYSQTNFFKDNDAGGVTLFRTFGGAYDFNDFAIYMKARSLLFSGDANRSMLARYFRYGSDGNQARVRFSNPKAPSSSISVGVDITSDAFTDIRIYLAGGAARNPTLRGSTKIGTASPTMSTNGVWTLVYALNLAATSATRTSNVTTLTLGLPAGITDHGLNINDTVWLQSTSGSFTSGAYQITARSTTTISYADVNANAGPITNIGTVSFDPQGEATLTGSGTVVGDYVNYASTSTSPFYNNTFYIGTVNAGSIITTSGEVPAAGFSAVTTLAWSQVTSAKSFSIFANMAQSANTILASVNALGAKCPISLTITSTGTGTIVKSTTETIVDEAFWYTLSDGVNWVKKTTPAINAGFDYSLTFKNPINTNLSTGSDWSNEIVIACPITINNLVEWLNTPSVTGLFTKATINASSDGTKLQIASKSPGAINGIQVQGGLGSITTAAVVGGIGFTGAGAYSTINQADGAGLTGGQWVSIQNTLAASRGSIIDNTYTLTSLSATGLLTVNNPLYILKVSQQPVKLMFERQGDYVAISDFGDNSGLTFNNVDPGDYIRIYVASSPTSFNQTSASNLGIYRVLRSEAPNDESNGTVWIQNPNIIEETSECAIMVIDGLGSILPGDLLSIGTPVWGIENQGTWTVKAVGPTTSTSGDEFTISNQILLDTSDRVPVPIGSIPALGTESSKVNVIEGEPALFIMKIISIAPNQNDSSFLDIIWDNSLFSSNISASLGSIINVNNKLGFNSNFVAGADGYAYDIGLIAEANKVLYGNQADPVTYPGVVSDGSNINISGPLVQRIQLVFGIRVKSPATEADVAARVRSTVASFINKSKIGKSIAISDIIDAASSVVGVTAVTMISPSYGIGHDLINVQPYSRPFILNLEQDIGIVFIGA